MRTHTMIMLENGKQSDEIQCFKFNSDHDLDICMREERERESDRIPARQTTNINNKNEAIKQQYVLHFGVDVVVAVRRGRLYVAVCCKLKKNRVVRAKI